MAGVYTAKLIEYVRKATSDAQISCSQFGMCTTDMHSIEVENYVLFYIYYAFKQLIVLSMASTIR